jgi:hypothetical protein
MNTALTLLNCAHARYCLGSPYTHCKPGQMPERVMMLIVPENQ